MTFVSAETGYLHCISDGFPEDTTIVVNVVLKPSRSSWLPEHTAPNRSALAIRSIGCPCSALGQKAMSLWLVFPVRRYCLHSYQWKVLCSVSPASYSCRKFILAIAVVALSDSGGEVMNSAIGTEVSTTTRRCYQSVEGVL